MIIKNLGRILLLIFLPSYLFGNVQFTQAISKKSIFLNETVKVTLKLVLSGEDKNTQVYFEDYDTDDFWTKKLTYNQIIKKENSTTYVYEYLIDAKSTGEFSLPKQKINISNKKIRKYIKWKKEYSNELRIEVYHLAENIPIQGDYSILAEVNKSKLKANESVSLTLEIKGKGNIQDIKDFSLFIEEQTVFKDISIVEKEFVDKSYEGIFTQKFLVVADKSFTIPSFSLKYFDMQKEMITEVRTKPIYIEVEEAKVNLGDDYKLKYIFALGGILLGFMSLFVFKYFKAYNKKKKTSLYIKIKKSKNDKELYLHLIKDKNNEDFSSFIKLLEENIYKDKKHKISKRDIIKRIKY